MLHFDDTDIGSCVPNACITLAVTVFTFCFYFLIHIAPTASSSSSYKLLYLSLLKQKRSDALESAGISKLVNPFTI